MNRSTAGGLIAVIVALSAVLSWQFVRGTWLSVQLSFADEHTEIFAEMVTKASEALNQSPPEVHAAVGYLQYVHTYYPSGTKQTVGSQLDIAVELTRSLAELQIIGMLRKATGTDLGDDAEDWIREYSD